MCNQLHRDTISIRKKGFGYKIIQKSKSKIRPMVNLRLSRSFLENDWNIWNPKKALYYGDIGFCFFLSKREANKCLNAWLKLTIDETNHYKYQIRKIQYAEGIGKHIESHIMKGFDFQIALCRKFKFMEGELDYSSWRHSRRILGNK